MSVANIRAQRVGFLWLCILTLLAGLSFASTASASYFYRAPYTNGDYNPQTLATIYYGSVGDAVNSSYASMQQHCPTCTITVKYSEPNFNSSTAATVVQCKLGDTVCNPANDVRYVVASEYTYDPAKNVGGCSTCKGGTQYKRMASAPRGASGDLVIEGTGGGYASALIGDPINMFSGNKFQVDTDFRASGSLSFRRFYNSKIVPTATLGSQWRHSFNRSLEFVPAPSGSTVKTINLNRPDGSREIYQLNSGVWTTSSDDPDVLTEQDDTNGNALGYTVYVASEQQYEKYSPAGLLLSITDQVGPVTTFAYSTASTPASIAPVPNLLLTVTDSKGRSLSFTYDSSGRISTVALPDGGTLSYGYDSNNRLTTVTYPDSHTRQYVYNESSLDPGTATQLVTALTGVIDEKGVRYESTGYNGSGNAISSSFAVGADTYSINNGVNLPLGATISVSNQTILGSFKVGSISAPCGAQCNQPYKSLTYDANGYPATVTDFNNNVTATTYNSVGLETQRIEARSTSAQRTINTTWDTNLRVPLKRQTLDSTGALKAQTSWVYNARGQTLATCDADPTVTGATSYTCAATGTVPAGVRRTTSTYCDAVDSTQCPIVGLLLTQKGARTDVDDTTTYAYYLTDSANAHHGDLKTVTDALGHTTTILSYDGAGRVTSAQDANGVVTTLTYKPRGWLASRSVAGATTTYTYTPFGAVETVTDPDGVVVTYAYDDAHRLTKITDAQGNYIQYTLDAAGDHTAENIYPAGSTTPVHTLTRTFNKLGQLTAVIDGLSHTVFNATASGSYDNNGNLVLSSDALGIQHKQAVDALNRVVSSIDNYNGTDTATKNTTTGAAYDALDQLTAVTDPGNLVTHYTYDGLGNRTALQSPDTGSSSDIYDAAGNRVTHTDARNITSTTAYDALNRAVATTYPDASSNVVYDYDEANAVTGCASSAPIGRLTRIVESAVTTVYCYDARGNVTQKKQVTATATDTISYTYTAADRLSTLTEPDGTVVTDTYNTLGQLTTVQVAPLGGATQTAVSSATYVPFGPVASYTLGNGQTVTRTYDVNYNVSDVISPALNLHFARDAMGNINALGNAPGANPAVETYSYDPLYRLTAVTDSGAAVESYTYNGTGDRLSKTSTGGMATGTYGYQTGTHWLTSIGSAARSYDVNGNTIGSASGGQTLGFGYNNRNRLSLVQANQQTVASYTYNALGQRVAKAVTSPSSVNERFVYNEASQIIGEYGTSNRDYIWLSGLPIAAVDSVSGTTATVNFVIADGLGASRVITSASGAQIWQWAYQGNPFGEHQPAGSFTYNLRFPGQYFDAEMGMVSNGFRDCYEPATGRYCQPDPAGYAAGPSLYSYVKNNPNVGIDPQGLQTLPPSTYTIDWTNPQSREALGIYALNMVPGYALYDCTKNGCGKWGWTFAGLGVLPGVGVISGIGREIRAVGSMCQASSRVAALGDLTVGEIGQIQSVVNKAGRPLDVVGSAAKGTRTAASDIDYTTANANYEYFDGLQDQLPSIDAEHGLLRGYADPGLGPSIRFEPGATPFFTSGAQ